MQTTLFEMPDPTPVDVVQQLEADNAIDFLNALSKALPRTSGNAFNHRLIDDVRRQLAAGVRRSLSPKQSATIAYIGIGIGFDFDHSTTEISK